jgi:hypothetical protein
MRGVAWKESVQRFEANAMRNIADIRRKPLAGENIQRGFAEFDLRERGKTRHIKSVHISERIVQKCLCDKATGARLNDLPGLDGGEAAWAEAENTLFWKFAQMGREEYIALYREIISEAVRDAAGGAGED